MVDSSCSPAKGSVLEKPVSRPNLDHEPSALLDGNIQAFLRRPSTVSEDTEVFEIELLLEVMDPVDSFGRLPSDSAQNEARQPSIEHMRIAGASKNVGMLGAILANDGLLLD
ncbi:conserved hypothetical protein [Histoplasma capsulatum var. duboisii H88]|uniref:Uncharacterized protein n=1 Tax=Ajellomyces capsulatus (strain H88) TaxID=544711 RepID=F0UU61_AJEC8|nr:conserved hypothetical protein [Histoplasma capsulatum var. duboisii H88]